MYVQGHVPGNAGGFVRVVDAVKGPMFPSPPPFPTVSDIPIENIIYAPVVGNDPLAPSEIEE